MDEGLLPLGRISASGDYDHGLRERMEVLEQLGKEWDGLYVGQGQDDVRTGGDVYRAVRGDLRALASALNRSFGLVVDRRQYGGGDGRGSVHQLQSCINELKNVAKDMASATRMANDNYNLQVELTLQKHASQHLLAQLHEAQLARMALEEEINALRAEGQRTASAEAQMAHLRQLNDDLQAEAQQAQGELIEMRRRVRELEERLEAQRLHAANLSARLREMELFEDSGTVTPVGEYASSDGGFFVGGGLAAVAAALGSAAAEHQSCPGGVGGAAGGAMAADGGHDGHPAAAGQRVNARELPPELRRLLCKVLRRRDAETAKLREENALLREELTRLRASAETPARQGSGTSRPDALGGCPSISNGTSGPHLAQDGDCARPSARAEATPRSTWRMSGDSWHTDDDLDWGTRPVTAEQGPQEQRRSRQPRAPQQQQEEEGHTARHGQQDHGTELAAARETIVRLRVELAEAQEQLQAQCSEAQRAAEAEADMRGRLSEAESQLQEQRRGAEAAAEAVASLRGQLAAERQLQGHRGCAQTASEAETGLRERLAAVEGQLQGHLGASAAAAEAEASLRRQVADLEDQLQAARRDAQAATAAKASLRLQLAEAEARAVERLGGMELAQSQLQAERDALAAELQEERQAAVAAAETSAAAQAATMASSTAHSLAEREQLGADLATARQQIATLEAEVSASSAAQAELQKRLSDLEQRERQAQERAVKELESTRQRLTRLQTDMRELRAEAQVARGEATAASRDVKAANSEKLKAQGEMEEAMERLRQAETARAALASQLEEAEAERKRLGEQLEQALAQVSAAAAAPTFAARDAEASAVGSHQAGSTVSLPDTDTASGRSASSSDAATGPAAAAAAGVGLAAALEAARMELASAEARLLEQRRGSEEEQGRLQQQLGELQAELAAVRQELTSVQAAAEERVALLEGQLTQHQTDAAAAARVDAERQQLTQQLAEVRRCLEDARSRVAELESQLESLASEASKAAEQRLEAQRGEHARAVAEAVAEAQRQAEVQQAALEEARQEIESRHAAEVEGLQARLAAWEAEAAEATKQAEAAAAHHPHGPAASPERPQCHSASSSDAGVSAAGSPEGLLGAATGPGAAVAGSRRDLEGADVDWEDLVAVRAHCRVLQGELGMLRDKLAALVALSDEATRGRLAEALERAQEAAAAGRVTTDEEFWTNSNEVHSLYALASSLRVTALYGGNPSGPATYGDTHADGAGSIVGPSSARQSSDARRRLLTALRQQHGQIAELLVEAAARVQTPAAAHPAATRGTQDGAAGVAGSSGSAGGSVGAPAATTIAAHRDGNGLARGAGPANGLAAAAGPGVSAAPCKVLSGGGVAALSGPRGTRAGESAPGAAQDRRAATYLGLEEQVPFCNTYGRHAGVMSEGGGHGLLLQPAGASSSFTSETVSSLPDDDFVGLNSMYELPPMASPPKFDFVDLDHLTNLAL